MDPNSMLRWLPAVQKLGIPHPRTNFVPVNREEAMAMLDGGNLSPAVWNFLRAGARAIGYPVFMRTDLCSGKHSWCETCFVQDEGVLVRNVVRLIEENEMAGIFGLDYEAIAFREYIPLFSTFDVKRWRWMPVSRERRYFVRGNQLLCHHPYWPAEALEGCEDCLPEDWRERLKLLNAEGGPEEMLLGGWARQVGAELGGCWSIDFAQSKSGSWYLIDMAVGEDSYHWPDCEQGEKLKSAAAKGNSFS